MGLFVQERRSGVAVCLSGGCCGSFIGWQSGWVGVSREHFTGYFIMMCVFLFDKCQVCMVKSMKIVICFLAGEWAPKWHDERKRQRREEGVQGSKW